MTSFQRFSDVRRADAIANAVLYGAAPRDPTIGEELREVFGVLRRSILLILAVTAVAVLMALAFIWVTPPLYSAKVELLIDPRQKQTLADEISPTGLGSSAVGADTLLLDSQLEVISSQSVLERLMREQDLLKDPEFVGVPSSPMVAMAKSAIKTVIYGPHEATWVQTSPYDRAMKKLRRSLGIDRERNTYVIAITMRSQEAEKAARIANRLAEIYIESTNNAASSTTREAATSLDSRLVELRDTAQKAAAEVERYRNEKGLIGAQDVLVVEQQLRDLNDQLSQARVDAQTALATLNQVKAAGVVGARVPTAEIGQSQVMSQLQTSLAEVEAQEAELSATHLSRHPRLMQLRERKAALLVSLKSEYQRILSRLQVNYDSAAERRDSIAAEVARLKSQMAASNVDSVRLRELQREADASRTVYETFLNRSKQAWEQVDIPNSTARIISEAYPATRPTYPPVPLLLAGALAVGLFAGLALAWFRHLMRAPAVERGSSAIKPLRTPSMLEGAGRTAP